MKTLKSGGALLLALALSVALTACGFENEEELFPPVVACDTVGVSFATDVKPVVDAQCLSCHSLSAAQGAVVLEQYSDYAPYTTSGKLVRAIEFTDSIIYMPPAGKLPNCDIAKIRRWVAEGALNN